MALPLLGAVVVLLVAAPAAQATFHLIKVREVFPASLAHPDSSYVELQMYSGGQNMVQNGNLDVFSATGTVTHSFTPSHSVAASADQSTVLIADSGYASQFPSGPTPDFTDPALDLSPTGGAVCWPQTEPPFDDCASWGNFSGQAMLASPDGAPALAAGVPNGMAIRRSIAGGNCSTLLEVGDDTNNSLADFAAVTPNPRNNATPPTEAPCTTPTTTIDSKPSNPTKATAASFTYHSSAGASFQCKLDTGAFAGCGPSGISYPGPLGEGLHSFEARATNVNGTGPAAIYKWTVDLTPPTATIEVPTPANPGPGKSTSFFFHSNENGSKFQCSLEPAGELDSFAACSSGATYVNLVDGQYVFRVLATDPAGNQGLPAEFNWTVDNSLLGISIAVEAPGESARTPVPPSQTVVRPQTVLSATPGAKTRDHTPTFRFRSDAPGASFECRIDGRPFTPCRSPFTARRLFPGRHSFKVRAVDDSGQADPSPASCAFKVLARAS